MSTICNGTRIPATQAQTVGTPTRTVTESYSSDPGLAASVSGPISFTAAPPRATFVTANAAFKVGTPVLIEGTNLNNGEFYVTGTNPNYLLLAPPPKVENAANATMRIA